MTSKKLFEKLSSASGYKARAAEGGRCTSVHNRLSSESNAVDASLATSQTAFSRRMVSAALSGAGSVVLKTALNILLVPILIQTLGLDLYALYILMIGVLELSIVLDLGFTAALVTVLGGAHGTGDRDTIRDTLTIGQTFYGAMACLTIFPGMLLIPVFAKWFHLPADLVNVAHVALALVLAEAALTLAGCYYRAILGAHCQYAWANVADTAFVVAGTTTGIIALWLGFGLPGVLACRLAAAAVRFVLLAWQACRVQPNALWPNGRFTRQTWRNITGLSLSAMLVNFSIAVSHKIDTFVIAAFMPLHWVGVFEIVFRFLSIGLQVANKVCEISFAMFSRLIAEGRRADTRRLFLRASALANLTVLVLMTIIVVLYPELFALFSAGKIPIKPTLPVLAVAVPCIWTAVLQMPAGYYLFNSGRQRYLTVTSLMAAGSNLILSLALVQVMGITGVALGTLIPQAVQHQAGLIRESCKDLGIGFREYVVHVHLQVLPTVAATALWLAVFRPLLDLDIPPALGLALITGSAAVFAAIVWLCTGASTAERNALRQRIPLAFRKTPGGLLHHG